MAAASTSRPCSDARAWATAPPARASRSVMVSHSACQPPAARSCSAPSASSTTGTRAVPRLAAVTAATACTGLRLCGMVDDPPRPGAAASATSPTSVWESSTTSPPILAAVPATMPRLAASSAGRWRAECQGRAGSARPSSAAKRAITSGPRVPKTARVPAAPPSCTARRARAPTRSRRASTTPASQPAALRPKVVGTACCSSVLAAMTVWRCRSARAAHSAASPSSSARVIAVARWATSTAAVSRMSWLVAPWCTWRRAGSGTAALTERTSGMTGFPPCLAARPSAAGSSAAGSIAAGSSNLLQAPAMALAASGGIRPAAASARASAASASSMARSHARSLVASSRLSGTRIGVNSESAGTTAPHQGQPVAAFTR